MFQRWTKMINLESLENSSEDSATDLETDFAKHDNGIGFSTLASLLKNANQLRRSVYDAARLVCQRTFRKLT